MTCLCLLDRTGLSLSLISCLNYTPDTFSQTTADVEITVSISLRRLSTIHIHIDHTRREAPMLKLECSVQHYKCCTPHSMPCSQRMPRAFAVLPLDNGAG